MSALDSDRTDSRTGSHTIRAATRATETPDIPGVMAGHVADLYAAAERERRRVGTERAIARARRDA